MPRRSLVLAKLTRPRLHDVLERTRLFDQLDRSIPRPVVWLWAQPGAGKTTLVASYLQARKRTGIWYQVDAADADPAAFVYHLRLAVESHRAAPHGVDALPLLTPEYRGDLRGFARRFFRELFIRLGPDAALVLDNFQEVDDESGFHALVLEAVEQVPESINLFVSSRSEPGGRYAPLLAGDAISVLGADDLRLSLDETKAIAARRGVQDDAAVRRLHERSHGWAAGLTLLMVRSARDADAADDDPDTLEHVFGYFAQRVFDGLSAEQQRALMQLAFVPMIDAALADRLTGQADLGRLLEHLHRRHLFTDRRRVATAAVDGGPGAGGQTWYQFHALFRNFLLHRARASFNGEQLRELAGRSAAVLDDAGHHEPALALYAEAGAWAEHGRALVRHAERLLEQGRQQTVVQWIERMPAAARDADPWLAYWHGRALATSALARALELLRSSHQRFQVAGDAAGEFAAAAAIVQALWHARLGWSEIEGWVDRLAALLGREVRFPSASLELMSSTALHAALTFCRIAHPAIQTLGARLIELIDDESIDWNQRLFTAAHLITWLHNAADAERAAALVAKVDPAAAARPASALNRAYWSIFRAMHDLRRGGHAEAARHFSDAEQLARTEGLAHAEFAAIQFRCYLDLLLGRLDEARARLARLETHPARANPDAAMNHALASTLLAQREGQVEQALIHARAALRAVDAVGAAYFRAVYPPMVAAALADGGEGETAKTILAASHAMIRGSYLEVMEAQLRLEEAYVEFVAGDAAAALRHLQAGLSLASRDPSRAAYIHRVVARKPMLLAQALAAGIEVRLVQQLIRRWRIAPPAFEVAAWPWPIRVRTLGGFEVRVDDAPIEFGRKAPKKTLALLKAVIARGGSATDANLIDTFWPDEEGDAAARSLAAAVHRLRGLLGDSDAVIQQGGQVALDRARVWVDGWAFEQGLQARPLSAETLSLYRGDFLPEEAGEPWPVAARERLRSKFVQAVTSFAEALEAARRDEEAIAWYLRGLEADSVIEPFYQGLMRCYHRLDRLPEAVSAYRRLKQTLSVTLSLPPSAGTERLYQKLRLGPKA